MERGTCPTAPRAPLPKPGRAVAVATLDARGEATVTRYRVLAGDATPERTIRGRWTPAWGAMMLGARLGVLPVGTRLGYRDRTVTAGVRKPEGYRPLDWRDRGGFKVWRVRDEHGTWCPGLTDYSRQAGFGAKC